MSKKEDPAIAVLHNANEHAMNNEKKRLVKQCILNIPLAALFGRNNARHMGINKIMAENKQSMAVFSAVTGGMDISNGEKHDS
ncbi:hypothetical protein [Pseudodesulfovibrio karagichevae]|uniref:Uncharacterized protein n=1 Tax=Pseudodesulfovibrio karagichevae TaxID=3239305 RepID=A0ABV4K6P2_9BACT